MSARLTPAAYFKNISGAVDDYKNVRDGFEALFEKSKFLPSCSLEPLKDTSLTDDENVREKRKIYNWSTSDFYPPHLALVPDDAQVAKELIFQSSRLQQVANAPAAITQFFSGVDGQLTMSSIEQRYKELHEHANTSDLPTVYTEANIGLRDDWYTDAVFAQQQLTGVNPTNLKKASDEWIDAFTQAATLQQNTAAQELIASSHSSLYVVDSTDLRYILGMAPDQPIIAASKPVPLPTGQTLFGEPAHGAASVTLFTLSDKGTLHPIAVCLDYKGSIAASVTIFNKRLTADAPGVNEKEDWPWRYAKMCANMSDWNRHEIAIHLTETHLIEEGIIVAAQRNLPDSHIIYQILQPHWFKTLSLNLLARQILVDTFISKVCPLELDQIKYMIRQSYANFDFTGRYAPTELKSRGFDPAKLNEPKFHNYLYAREISKCWDVIRSYVSDVLHDAYPCGDSEVRDDKYLAGFIAEMRSINGGQLTSFPVVKTLEELIDMVTMCIQIAAPQHNAINYLQQFYLSFVPNRPGSFSTPVPTTLEALQAYTEQDIIKALPIGGFADRIEWMLMSQVPFLLSAEVDVSEDIEQYAESTKTSKNKHIAKAGPTFSKNIKALHALFEKYDKEKDDQKTAYHVLDPRYIARSILI